MQITCRVNGNDVEIEGHPMERLLDALRLVGVLVTFESPQGEEGPCAVL